MGVARVATSQSELTSPVPQRDQCLNRTGSAQINADNNFSLLLYTAIDAVIPLSLYYRV